jgi:integrase
MKYYVDGRPVRESTGCEKEQDARRVLKEREGRVAAGGPMLPRVDRIRYEEIQADLRHHYEATGSRHLDEYTYRVAHLTAFFAGRRIASLGQPDADAYTAKRQEAGAVGSTIRRELGTLRRMLRLAYENGKLLRLPILHLPKDGAPREGFFERDRFEAVCRRLAPDLQAALTVSHTFGWRMQSEVLTLERRQVDLKAGTLRLEAAQLERVEALQKRLGRSCPLCSSS